MTVYVHLELLQYNSLHITKYTTPIYVMCEILYIFKKKLKEKVKLDLALINVLNFNSELFFRNGQLCIFDVSFQFMEKNSKYLSNSPL